VYGTTTPGPDAKSQFGGSSSLESYKKNISYYMPNKLLGWNVETKTGNPTRSVPVNQLIRKVKKMKYESEGKVRVQGDHWNMMSLRN